MEVLKFKNLRRLELGDNQLTAIPEEIRTLEQLVVLGLSRNKLTSLPYQLWLMPRLQEVIIDHNLFPKKEQKALEKAQGFKLYPQDEKERVLWE